MTCIRAKYYWENKYNDEECLMNIKFTSTNQEKISKDEEEPAAEIVPNNRKAITEYFEKMLQKNLIVSYHQREGRRWETYYIELPKMR